MSSSTAVDTYLRGRVSTHLRESELQMRSRTGPFRRLER